MALRHDILARFFQVVMGRFLRPRPGLVFSGSDLPPPETLTADTEAGPVRVDVYRPTGAGSDAPVYINFHGGGFVVGAPRQDDHICRHLAAELGCVVLNAEYAVAPQARFPVAVHQAQALAWWARMAGRKHGWDGKRIVLGGQSAGGNLAIGACLDMPARIAFKPLGVVAVFPPLDLATPPEDKTAPIARPLISPRRARIFFTAYVPDAVSLAAPLVSPLRAESVAGFPPTLISVAEFDTLRAEGVLFADRLEAAGVVVRRHEAKGVDHGYTHTGPREAVANLLAEITGFAGPLFVQGSGG